LASFRFEEACDRLIDGLNYRTAVTDEVRPLWLLVRLDFGVAR
jgi:hypothetical protein